MPGVPRAPTAGRKPGTLNRKTLELQSIVESKLGKSLPEAILELVDKMDDPEKKAATLSGLLPYIYAKQKEHPLTDELQFILQVIKERMNALNSTKAND